MPGFPQATVAHYPHIVSLHEHGYMAYREQYPNSFLRINQMEINRFYS